MSKNSLESKQRAFQEKRKCGMKNKWQREVWCHSTKVGVTVICSRWMVGIVPRPAEPVSPEGLLGANSQTPSQTYWIRKLWEQGPEICILTCLLVVSDVSYLSIIALAI